MSWDIFVQDIPEGVTSVAEIANDFVPKSVGTRRENIEKICAVVPRADFTDPCWGVNDGAGYSIEVNLGKEEELDGFAFHIRGREISAFVVADILWVLDLP